ncbi:MAG: CrcB family protein [Acidimicrobiia bacterium]
MQPVVRAPRHHLAALVIAGGMLGSALRVGVVALVPSTGFPWATVIVNLTGSLVVGWMLPTLHSRSRRQRRVAFGAVGVAAAYTTFATFAIDAMDLVHAGRWSSVAGYLAISVLGGLAAAAVGHSLGERS